MQNVTGGVVRGANFFDRETELADLWELLERDHLLLLAPRRVGKTSLLYRMLDDPAPGWRGAYLDVMSAESEPRFVARLTAALYRLDPGAKLWKDLGKGLDHLLDRIGKVGAGPVELELTRAVGNDWQSVGEQALGLADHLERRLVVLIDELPIFVGRVLAYPDGAARAELLLHWFRALRTTASVSRRSPRFLVAGSIGLDTVVSRVRLSGAIADLSPVRLGPLSVDAAQAMMEILGVTESCPMSTAAIERTLDRIVWRIPYHLQLLFREIWRLHKDRSRPVGAADVDLAYDRLLAPEKRKEFAHWEERLDREFWTPAERDLLDALLEAAARDPEGATGDVLRQVRIRTAPGLEEQPLLQTLEHDGYLVRDGDRWRFASSLLRDWWLRWKVTTP